MSIVNDAFRYIAGSDFYNLNEDYDSLSDSDDSKDLLEYNESAEFQTGLPLKEITLDNSIGLYMGGQLSLYEKKQSELDNNLIFEQGNIDNLNALLMSSSLSVKQKTEQNSAETQKILVSCPFIVKTIRMANIPLFKKNVGSYLNHLNLKIILQD